MVRFLYQNICILFLIFLVTGSSELYSKNADPKLRDVTLQLKWKHQFQFAGYYAAIEKGYFRDAGINVKLLEAGDSVDTNDAVFNGIAQFGISTSEVLLLRAKGKNPVVLASVFQHSPVILLSLEKSSIKHAFDLIGKRLALEKNSHEMVAYLTSEGVPLDQCKIITPTYDISQLINNEVDAISAYSTDMPFQLEELNINYTVISPLMGGLDFYGDVLFTTANLIKSDPELVANFRAAALKGWKYAMDHQNEIVDLIYNKYTQRHSKEYLLHEAEHMKSLIMKDLIEIGYSNPDRWQHILEIYQKLNLTSKTETIKGLLYADYLEKGYTIPWKLFFVFLLIIIFVCSVTWFFYSTSRKLKIEIKNRIKVQNELAASEEHYKSVIAASPDTIVITDLNGVVQFVSSMVKKMFGYNEEEIVNQPILKYIDPIYHAKAQYAIGQMFKGSFTGATEYRAIKSDGCVFDIE